MPATVTSYVGGVLIALVTTALSAAGLTLQKLAHLRRAATAAAAPRAHWSTEPLFVAGIACMVVSALVSLAVFALVGQAVASAFSALTIVYGLAFGVLVLGERCKMSDGLLAALLVLGAVLCVVFGHAGAADDAGPALSPAEVSAFFSRTIVTVAAPLVVLVMAACGAALVILRARRHARSSSAAELRANAGVALLLAGLFSGVTGTCSRGFIALVASATYGGARSAAVASSPHVYLFLVALLTSLVFQIMSLNAALKLRPAKEVVPVYQAAIVRLWAQRASRRSWLLTRRARSMTAPRARALAADAGRGLRLRRVQRGGRQDSS